MEDNAQSSLQHVPTGSGLSLHTARSGMIARGRRDAANAASNPHYKRALEQYNAGDHVAAAASFRLAADQGHAESQYILSTFYDEGTGVAKDDEQAAYWERKAAAHISLGERIRA